MERFYNFVVIQNRIITLAILNIFTKNVYPFFFIDTNKYVSLCQIIK